MTKGKPKAYTPERFAEILGVHVETIRRKIRNEEIKATNIGGEAAQARWVIPRTELEQFIDDGTDDT